MDVNDHILIVGDWYGGGNDKQDRSRRSENKIINVEGIQPLRLGEELGLEIRNGNIEGDWKDEATYVGCNAGSVIDLLLERRVG